MELGLEIASAPRAGAGAWCAAPTGVLAPAAEQATEDVRQVFDAEVEVAAARALATTATEAAEVAERTEAADLVVLLALFCVAEDVVGGRDRLEAVLGTRVRVWVVLLGELAVGAAKILVGRRRGDAQHLVEVGGVPIPLRGHGLAQSPTRTMAGRSTFDLIR